jgi:hypothetical protein
MPDTINYSRCVYGSALSYNTRQILIYQELLLIPAWYSWVRSHAAEGAREGEDQRVPQVNLHPAAAISGSTGCGLHWLWCAALGRRKLVKASMINTKFESATVVAIYLYPCYTDSLELLQRLLTEYITWVNHFRKHMGHWPIMCICFRGDSDLDVMWHDTCWYWSWVGIARPRAGGPRPIKTKLLRVIMILCAVQPS